MSNEERSIKIQHSIPWDILSDIITKFLIHVPPESKKNMIRIFFQIEMAHWYYLDFYASTKPNLKACSITEFAYHVFNQIPVLKEHINELPEIIEEWRSYKQSVPTYGAVLISENLTHVLLVQSYFSKSSWSFPKGKINEAEDPTHCAIREVAEETGYDIAKQIHSEFFIETFVNEQLVRLYVILGVPMDFKFQPKTRGEIKACDWFLIADLPTSKKDPIPKNKKGLHSNSFYMIYPFIKKIKAIVNPKDMRERLKSKSVTGKQENEVSPLSKEVRKVVFLKRQLFSDKSMQNPPAAFGAPCWLNFKLDRTAIMDCIP